MKNKKLIALVCTVLLLVGAAGATLAWLTDQTTEVKNTFTASNIDIDLKETDQPYKMIPGHSIDKDPVVSVVPTSEDCYLFVKVTENGVQGKITNEDGSERTVNYSFDAFLSYNMAAGWSEVPGTTDVYYRIVMTEDTTKSFSVLRDDKVYVSSDVTKGMMDDLQAPVKDDEGNTVLPTLTFKAYAVQYYSADETPFSVADAWANAQSVENN